MKEEGEYEEGLYRYFRAGVPLQCVGCHDPHPFNTNYRYLRVDTKEERRWGRFAPAAARTRLTRVRSDPSRVPRIALGSDHAGFSLKSLVKGHLKARGISAIDIGADSADSVDYPDFARKVVDKILGGEADLGILICGTGIGMSMAANRHRGIRAALCHDHFTASAARRHNNANILAMGGRLIGPDLAKEIVDTWLDTPFEGGRHKRRTDKMDR
ncbi:MAG: ribose 5-phosphate isomerase B [Deltaproteobacteria bacterium]|nr:ribose 5-phosphate isomerase B [Deltaproteobacteria bacterium]